MERYRYPFFPLMMIPLFIHYFLGCNLARILVPNLNTDQSSLLALKSQISSDPYNILTNNWTSKTSVCSWIGVTCGRRHNRVTALSIPNMGLKGIIPPEIGNLSFLVSLNMNSNFFYGNLPMELAHLRRLRVVNFYRNNITGELPKSWFGSLHQLEFLVLGRNSLQGIIPLEIGNFSKLELLVLEFNQLTGPVPPIIFNISTLEKVYLYSNRLTGRFPDSICSNYNSYRLKFLSLAANELQGQIPLSWCQCSQLQVLSLSHNKVSGAIPGDIGNMTELEELYLIRSNLTGIVPRQIGHLRNLKILDIGDNKIVGPIPATIGSLVGLINMSLAHNRLQGPIPDSVSKMLNLERLDLSVNNLSGVIPKSLETLQYLTYFNVSFNNLSGEIPSDGPFTKFTDQYFMFNNKDLCGASRFGVAPCPINSIQNPRKKKKFNKVVIVSLGVAVGIIIALTVLLLMKYRKKSHNTPNVSLLLSPQRHRRISYYELQQATNWYNDSNLLGTGGFSSVYKGVLQDGTPLAVKVFTLEVQGSLKGFDAECEVLRNLRHRNLTKVICSCSNEDFKALVLDYMPNGSLDRWLYSHNYFLDIAQRLSIMIDVATALEYLHHGYSTPVIHCDLKPSNVLLDEDMIAHVSDFGMAKLMSEEDSATYTRTLATLGYMAPEYGMEGTVSPKCDVYSYGIMLMEVFTRTKPSDEIFSGDLNMRTWVQNSLPNEVMQVVDSNLLDPKDEQQLNKKLKCLTSIMELAISCTPQSPRDRITIKDVLSTLEKFKSKLLQRL